MKIKDGVLFHAAPWDFDLGFNFACMPRYFTNALTGVVDTGVRLGLQPREQLDDCICSHIPKSKECRILSLLNTLMNRKMKNQSFPTILSIGATDMLRRGWNVENSRSDALWIGPLGFPGGSVQESLVL